MTVEKIKPKKIISQCCVCKRTKRKDEFKFSDRKHMDEWGHHEDIPHIEKEFDVLFSHGLCEECYDNFEI